MYAVAHHPLYKAHCLRCDVVRAQGCRAGTLSLQPCCRAVLMTCQQRTRGQYGWYRMVSDEHTAKRLHCIVVCSGLNILDFC